MAIKRELREMANAMRLWLNGDQTYAGFFDGDCIDISYWMDRQMSSGHTARYDSAATVDNDDWEGDAILDEIDRVTSDFRNDEEGLTILKEEVAKL